MSLNQNKNRPSWLSQYADFWEIASEKLKEPTTLGLLLLAGTGISRLIGFDFMTPELRKLATDQAQIQNSSALVCPLMEGAQLLAIEDENTRVRFIELPPEGSKVIDSRTGFPFPVNTILAAPTGNVARISERGLEFLGFCRDRQIVGDTMRRYGVNAKDNSTPWYETPQLNLDEAKESIPLDSILAPTATANKPKK